jgi:large subunit ribosomal protein L22
MINTSLFILLSLRNIKISQTKLNTYLKPLNLMSYDKIVELFNKSSNKTNYLLKRVLYAGININFPINENLNIIVLKAFGNKGAILKRIQPRAKGQAFPIQKKLSHLTIYLTHSYIYRVYKFINLII